MRLPRRAITVHDLALRSSAPSPGRSRQNTCYVNALNAEYDSSEQYGLALARDILDRHSHIQVVNLFIEERPWTRVVTSSGEEHNHVFMKPKDPHKVRGDAGERQSLIRASARRERV